MLLKKMVFISAVFTLIFIFFFTNNSNCQSLESSEFFYVTANSGLVLRKKANLQSGILAVVKYGESVKLLSKYAQKDTIDGIISEWISVRYNEMEGFMFKGYLSILPRPKDVVFERRNYVMLLSIVGEYFTILLSKLEKIDVQTIVPCGDDIDCKNGIFKDTYQMTKGFILIETRMWDGSVHEMIRNDWQYLDVIDIVDSIVEIAKIEGLEISGSENSTMYAGENYSVTIEKMENNRTSIIWETSH